MFTVGIQRGPSYLLAVATGPADAAENCAGVLFVADILRRTCTKRLLFDITGLRPRFEKADALEVLSTLYACIPPLERIAVLVAPGESQGFVLEVAQHRCVPAQEFDSAEAADEWLRA